jgi:predicted anti-sigma-YlaC factor YlaD
VSCNSARQGFSDHLDGQRMPAWTRLIVWAHLHFCPRCRRVYRSMQATGEALAALKEEPPL